MYTVIEEIFFTNEGEPYITYGIESGNGKKVSDVSLNKEKIYKFVEEINMDELAGVHLMDVIEDNLNELI